MFFAIFEYEIGSFELIKIFLEIFFTESLSGSGPEIHRLVDATEEISVSTKSLPNRLSFK